MFWKKKIISFFGLFCVTIPAILDMVESLTVTFDMPLARLRVTVKSNMAIPRLCKINPAIMSNMW